MATINRIIPFILKWEGGFVNDPLDLGGATNKGITIGTYQFYCKQKGLPKPTISNLKNISDEDWKQVLKTLFWDKWQADQIENQSVANILVDWVWASGSYGIKIPQRLLGVEADGVVGSHTLFAVNNYQSDRDLFDKIRQARFDYIDRICASRAANKRFRKGWINRINDIIIEK